LTVFGTASRLHVKIEDAAGIAYQVPESIFPRPDTSGSVPTNESQLEFAWKETPFSFTVTRRSNGEVLFDSSAAPLIFSNQYIRLRTSLPRAPNLYGLGEHSDNLRLNTTNYTRTLWSRDAYGIPSGTNLYGNHPVYYDHRGERGTHGVFMLSSVGMDVNISNTEADGQYLEYNMLGGVVDLHFMAGPSPVQVTQQYSEIVGKSTLMPYWSFGLHQCRYGYRDFIAIAEVVYNYSAAGIPLETMWTDIDYMYNRLIMTTDPERFPIEQMREIVRYLHDHDQHFIVMVDPAVAYQTKRENGLEYTTFTRARDEGLFLSKNGTIFKGVVWPGVTAFPDWFNPKTSQYWTEEFMKFFSPERGIDIDGLWIDMVILAKNMRLKIC
jgi:alpha-glucosidase